MRVRRIGTSAYVLPGAALLAALVAIAGCDNARDEDEMSLRTVEPSLTAPPEPEMAGASGDSRSDSSGRGASNQAQSNERDQNIADRSDEAARNAQFSLVGSATAQIMPTSLGQVEGTVTFTAGEDGQVMRVAVELEGLQAGLHGFHIHEVGDCSADDASSAGGHFDPHEAPHGSPENGEHHAGDMGNIEADSDGRVDTELTFQHLAFSGPASILQKAVVIHSGEDDSETQPAGGAGDRVGCGVIRVDSKVFAQ
jgi:superoxide dismutase, Cu-Zn family